MPEHAQSHALASFPGMLAIFAWALYVVSAVLYFPEFPPSVLAIGISGIVACLAVAFNFKYWRAVVVLACLLYLILYVVRVVRMTGLTTDASFLSSLSFYYSASWSLGASMFQEKGVVGGMTHAFLEFIMPVLVIVLLAVTLVSWRPNPGDSR
jgi:hypothetical protein